MKRLGVLYSTLDGMLVHHRVPSVKQLGTLLLFSGWYATASQGSGYPPVTQYFDVMVQPGTHLNTWVERDKVG